MEISTLTHTSNATTPTGNFPKLYCQHPGANDPGVAATQATNRTHVNKFKLESYGRNLKGFLH